jgi:hypothetical protein
MKAGRVETTMEEECREMLHSVNDAMAQEMRRAPGCTPPDGARIAACLYLQRAVLHSVMMQRERATCRPPFRRPAITGSPRSEKLQLQ